VSASYAGDLELARRCAAGEEAAWERFMIEYRPALYRAADALDPTGGARDLADSLYADLYGLPQGETERRSLFRYYQARSSLATWLRAVLSQRYVDRLRAQKRLDPLPDDDSRLPSPAGAAGEPPDPNRSIHAGLLRQALAGAVGTLEPRDRFRMSCYYAQGLTLAETGRLLKEHEATVSRQLARTRRTLRALVEGQLRTEHGLGDVQIAECFESAAEDAGPLDLGEMLEGESPDERARRKKSAPNRSLS